MAQVKKQQVREAILASAYKLFKERGYNQTSMAAIAREAGTAVANIYVYFPTKMDLLYEEYMPRMTATLLQLGNEAKNISEPRKRLKYLLTTLWQDLPLENEGYSRNLMQAIALSPQDEEKPHGPLQWNVEFVHDLIRNCLPADRQHLLEDTSISFLIWMAFDGFAINVGRGESCDYDQLTNHLVAMLYGD